MGAPAATYFMDPIVFIVAVPIAILVIAGLILARAHSPKKVARPRPPDILLHPNCRYVLSPVSAHFEVAGPGFHAKKIPYNTSSAEVADAINSFPAWDGSVPDWQWPEPKQITFSMRRGDSWPGAFVRYITEAQTRPNWRKTPLGEVLEA